MIRNYRKTDLEEMVNIWYDASVLAHPFVPPSFWAFEKKAMREEYLLLAENFVFVEAGKVTGFISLVGEKVCAIFVAPEKQGKGVGSALLKHVMVLRRSLNLKVYRDNKNALEFYKKCGFTAVGDEIDEITGCTQIHMEWRPTQDDSENGNNSH